MDKATIKLRQRQFMARFPTMDWLEQLEFIRFNQRFFEMSVSTVIQIYLQNPNVSDLRTFEEWRDLSKLSSVEYGERGILIERQGKPEPLFDIKQTTLAGNSRLSYPELTEQQFLGILGGKPDEHFLQQAEETVRNYLATQLTRALPFTQKENAAAAMIALYNNFNRFGLLDDSRRGRLEDAVRQNFEAVENPERLLNVLNLGNSFSRGVSAQLEQGQELDFEQLTDETQDVPIVEADKNQPRLDLAKELDRERAIREVLQKGSHFSEGKLRIAQFFRTHAAISERVKFLAREYGQGGASSPDDPYRENHDKRGIQIQVKDEQAKDILLSWSEVAARLDFLMAEEDYLQGEEHKAFDDWLVKENAKQRENTTEAPAASEKLDAEPSLFDFLDENESVPANSEETLSNQPEEQELQKMDDMSEETEWTALERELSDGIFDFIAADSELFEAVMDGYAEIDVSIHPQNQKMTVSKVYAGGVYQVVLFHVSLDKGIFDWSSTPFSAFQKTELERYVKERLEQSGVLNVQGNIQTTENQSEALNDESVPEVLETPEQEKQAKTPEILHDFSFQQLSDDEFADFYPKTPTEKVSSNLAVIKMLKQLGQEKRQANEQEQKVLARYVGWGGLANSFFDESNPKFSEFREELKTLVSKQEYSAMRESSLTAYYTDPEIIQEIYATIHEMGFQGGRILDPSMGSGNFFASMPEEMKEQSELYGVELDSITGRIAKQLQQSSNIQNRGFETTDFAAQGMDCVISNIPFGDFSLSDDKMEHPYLIHDYFIKKSLDLVHEGGFVVAITSTGTMDKRDSRFRSEIAEQANLVKAVRLPSNAFSRLAGTDATSDILIFQKTSSPELNPDWIKTSVIEDGKDNAVDVNQYFEQHPEQVLGTIKVESFRGGVLSVKADYEREELPYELRAALENNEATYFAENANPEVFEPVQAEDGQIPYELIEQAEPYTIFIYQGQPYFKAERWAELFHKTATITLRDNESRQAQLHRYEKIKGQVFDEQRVDGGIQYFYHQPYNPQEVEAMRQMIGLRQSLKALLALQHHSNYAMSDYERLRQTFNDQYDAFVKQFGAISERSNSLLMRQNDYYEFLASVEVEQEDPETGKKFYEKGAVFFEPTIQAHAGIVKVKTAEDALLASLNHRGEMDFDYMADVYDKSKAEMIEELGERLFYVGEGNYETREDYLSGDVKTKLQVAKNNQEFSLEGVDWMRNIEALEDVIPKDIPISDIDYKIGTRFIPTDYYQEFLSEALGQHELNDVSVLHDRLTDSYHVKISQTSTYDNRETYGIGRRYDGQHLATTLLNMREPQVYMPDPNDETGQKRILDKDATSDMRAKSEAMKMAFKEWILQHPKAQETIVSIYNNLHNRKVPKTYDGSGLTVNGLAKQYQFLPHQANGVMRVVQDQRAGIFFEVGLGKTLTLLASGMKLRELGVIQKPMYVVPKPLLEQFGREIYSYFPESKVLIAHSEDFTKANRKRFISRIQTGKYDAIVIADSQFEKIAMSKSYRLQFLESQMSEARQYLAGLEEKVSIKKAEKYIKGLKARIKKLEKKDTDDFVSFEDLRIDMLFVDEAHNYKNLAPMTQLQGVKGISDTRSQRAMDMKQKIDYLHEQFGNKRVVFSTGTPISNSVTELYTMMDYLAPDLLEEQGIAHFDSWVSTFGTIESVFELTAAGGYKVKRRFTKFGNMPELGNLFREIADIQLAEDADLPLPAAETVVHQTETTRAQKEYIQSLVRRVDRIEAGLVEPWTDNMLKIVGENRKLTLDMRMLDDNEYRAGDSDKLEQVVESVYQTWKDTQAEHSAQMIFSDLGVPMKYRNTNSKNLSGSVNSFSAYDEIKRQLVLKGIPEQEIRFIHEATDATKNQMMRDVRAGKIRVLIASTGKGGTGLNVQDKLIAVHHLDVPWRPSDITQRNGRLIRQGNENPKVYVHYYITKGSMDSFLWQTQENKLKFINQIMSGKSNAREMEELDNNDMNPSTFKALSEGDPLKAEYMQLENELKVLGNARNRYYESKAADERRIDNLREKLPLYEKRLAATKEDVAQAELTTFKPFEMTLYYQGQAKHYGVDDKKTEIGEQFIQLIQGNRSEEKRATKIADYRGFEIYNSSQPKTNLLAELDSGNEIITIKGQTQYTLSLPLTSGTGTLERINNKIDGLVKDQEATAQEIERLNTGIQRIEAERDKTFVKEDEFTEKTARFNALRSALGWDSPKPKDKERRLEGEDDYEAAM